MHDAYSTLEFISEYLKDVERFKVISQVMLDHKDNLLESNDEICIQTSMV